MNHFMIVFYKVIIVLICYILTLKCCKNTLIERDLFGDTALHSPYVKKSHCYDPLYWHNNPLISHSRPAAVLALNFDGWCHTGT